MSAALNLAGRTYLVVNSPLGSFDAEPLSQTITLACSWRAPIAYKRRNIPEIYEGLRLFTGPLIWESYQWFWLHCT